MNKKDQHTENTIELSSIENKHEKAVLKLLQKKETCIYGDIIKELKISVQLGQQTIFSLINKGMIKHKFRSSKLELNIRIKS